MNVNDTTDLVNVAYQNHAKLKNNADKARFLGGISVGGFGIPSQFLGLDLRTANQKFDQQLPPVYLNAMLELIKEIDKVLDVAASKPGEASNR
jgi:hypothetical protein